LLFDKALAEKLSLNIKFPRGRTETQAIGSATRSQRELTDRDVEVLLEAIKSSEEEGVGIETILSTDEVTEVIEKDIERFISKNLILIGESLTLVERQLYTPVGRMDLLFEDGEGNLIVVELKLDRIGRDAIRQVRRYMNWVKEATNEEVVGVVVCKGVMPAFQEDLKKLRDIKIFCYGWQLKVYPWSGTE
jgi:RecB family endonuclease NucS